MRKIHCSRFPCGHIREKNDLREAKAPLRHTERGERLRLSPLRLSKKPSAGVCRPQAANTIQSFFPRRVRGKNTLRGVSVNLCATGAQPRRRAKRNPSQKSGTVTFLTRKEERGGASLLFFRQCTSGNWARLCKISSSEGTKLDIFPSWNFSYATRSK